MVVWIFGSIMNCVISKMKLKQSEGRFEQPPASKQLVNGKCNSNSKWMKGKQMFRWGTWPTPAVFSWCGPPHWGPLAKNISLKINFENHSRPSQRASWIAYATKRPRIENGRLIHFSNSHGEVLHTRKLAPANIFGCFKFDERSIVLDLWCTISVIIVILFYPVTILIRPDKMISSVWIRRFFLSALVLLGSCGECNFPVSHACLTNSVYFLI